MIGFVNRLLRKKKQCLELSKCPSIGSKYTMLFKSYEHFHLLTTDRWTDGRTDSRIIRGYLRNIGFMIEKSSILRKTIEGYLDPVPSLTFNTIKTKPIMHAFHSSRYLQ